MFSRLKKGIDINGAKKKIFICTEAETKKSKPWNLELDLVLIEKISGENTYYKVKPINKDDKYLLKPIWIGEKPDLSKVLHHYINDEDLIIIRKRKYRCIVRFDGMLRFRYEGKFYR